MNEATFIEEEFQANGINRIIEEILKNAGHDPRLARQAPNSWEITQGSARISISYYEPGGLISGDAMLCELPKEHSKQAYEFLLRQNFELEGLTLSVDGQAVVLSLIIFDRYLNLETGQRLFQHLFEKADYFDNILVEQFGATWKS
mgnify:CR=1 FL=1